MRRAAGFTLLEMLIVIAITALIVTTAVQSHLTIRQVQSRAALGLSRDRAAEIFLDRFERELAGSFLVVRNPEEDRLSDPYVFVGEDRFEAEADADAIRFVTRTPARAEPYGRSSGLRMVTYALRTADDGSLELMREESLLPEQMEKEPVIQEGRVALDHVASFRLGYMNDDSGEWIEHWDSTDVALLDRLPAAVEATVVVEEETDVDDDTVERAEWEHKRVMPLPVRPFDLAELRAEALGGGAKDDDPNSPDDPNTPPDTSNCVTIDECARQLGLSNDPEFLMFSRDYSKTHKCYNPRSSMDRWFTSLLKGRRCP